MSIFPFPLKAEHFDLYTQGDDIRYGGYRSYVNQYMGSTDGMTPASPFGGRDVEIKHLNDWLFEGNPQYSLLTANAGMGKSALILHWLDELKTDSRFEEWELVYWPISARYNINTEQMILESLDYQVAEARDDN